MSSKRYNNLPKKTLELNAEKIEKILSVIKKNCTVPNAAGQIHTDFERGFIRAETISYKDFIKNSGWLNSKNNGDMRLEGKDYLVKDGDILNFRFNT